MAHLQIGTNVKWRWGAHWAHGRIEQVLTEKTTRTIRGAQITRHASPEEPAYLITQPRGGVVLKNGNEITPRIGKVGLVDSMRHAATKPGAEALPPDAAAFARPGPSHGTIVQDAATGVIAWSRSADLIKDLVSNAVVLFQDGDVPQLA